MTNWIKCSDNLPPLSYVGSDNADHPYESIPVLLYSDIGKGCGEGSQCIGYLVENEDENDWDFGELSWEIWVPGGMHGGDLLERDLHDFSHWAPLPQFPKEDNIMEQDV